MLVQFILSFILWETFNTPSIQRKPIYKSEALYSGGQFAERYPGKTPWLLINGNAYPKHKQISEYMLMALYSVPTGQAE
jgi:hypothetical protein